MRAPHAAKDHPWRIKTAITFADRTQAFAFESHPKWHSGRAYAKKLL